ILFFFCIRGPRRKWRRARDRDELRPRYTRARTILYYYTYIILCGHAFIGDYRSTNCDGSNIMYLYRYNNNNI
ncbi:Uncharacterized protein FWK35_00001956, partial [Aphis craccivora]